MVLGYVFMIKVSVMVVSTIAHMIIFTKKKRKKNFQTIKDIDIQLKQ